MVMKYEGGPNLKQWRTQLGRAPAQRELDRLLAPLLDSLELLHAAGFLHRDIAPDNIIVRADGTPVLLDFGASRRVMGELTGTLTAMIKPGFSPAEQYTADQKLQGPWTDIYALGATLYQTVTGNKPTEALERVEDRTSISGIAGGYRRSYLEAIDAAMRFRPETARRRSLSSAACYIPTRAGQSRGAGIPTARRLTGGLRRRAPGTGTSSPSWMRSRAPTGLPTRAWRRRRPNPVRAGTGNEGCRSPPLLRRRS